MTNSDKENDPRFQAILGRMSYEPNQRRMMFTVDSEWLPIVYETDAKLAEIDPDYTIAQVKEKFGGLRYYFSTKTDKITEMLKITDWAERRVDEIEKEKRAV